MNLKKLRIVVDEREKKSGIPDLLKEIGINLEIKTLPVGDYIVAPETVVERKTISDLISSIFDGRLFDQCNRLKEHYQFPILLIEGDIDEIEKLTENPFVFYGAISSIVIDFKIPVIPTPSASHTSKLLISMCSRKDIANGPFIKKIRKSNNLQKQQLSMLCSLPGVGEKTIHKSSFNGFSFQFVSTSGALCDFRKICFTSWAVILPGYNIFYTICHHRNDFDVKIFCDIRYSKIISYKLSTKLKA